MEQVKDLVATDCRVFTATVAFAAVGAAFLGFKAFSFLRTLLEVYVFSGIPVTSKHLGSYSFTKAHNVTNSSRSLELEAVPGQVQSSNGVDMVTNRV